MSFTLFLFLQRIARVGRIVNAVQTVLNNNVAYVHATVVMAASVPVLQTPANVLKPRIVVMQLTNDRFMWYKLHVYVYHHNYKLLL